MIDTRLLLIAATAVARLSNPTTDNLRTRVPTGDVEAFGSRARRYRGLPEPEVDSDGTLLQPMPEWTAVAPS